MYENHVRRNIPKFRVEIEFLLARKLKSSKKLVELKSWRKKSQGRKESISHATRYGTSSSQSSGIHHTTRNSERIQQILERHIVNTVEPQIDYWFFQIAGQNVYMSETVERKKNLQEGLNAVLAKYNSEDNIGELKAGIDALFVAQP